MNVVEVKTIDGTYTLYNSNGDVIGKVCTDTDKAMIGNAFYEKVRTCHNVAGDENYADMMFKCSECGCELFLEREYYNGIDDEYWVEPNMWVDGKASYPSYCPNCKAVIVEEQL